MKFLMILIYVLLLPIIISIAIGVFLADVVLFFTEEEYSMNSLEFYFMVDILKKVLK